MKGNGWLIMLFFCTISTSVSANNKTPLESDCLRSSESGDNEKRYFFKKGVHIKSYSISTIVDKNAYGFYITIDQDNSNYKVILKNTSEAEYRNQFSSTVRMAKALNLPVNICVDSKAGNGYLVGIELF